MNITMNRLLELKPVKISTSECWLNLSAVDEILDTYEMTMFLSKEMTKRLAVKDYCEDRVGDMRGRTMEVITLDDKPVVFFQNVGRGSDNVNIKVLNKELLNEIYMDYCVGKMNEVDMEDYGCDKDEEFGLSLYGGEGAVYKDEKIIVIGTFQPVYNMEETFAMEDSKREV